MKVILTTNIKKLGKVGDLVKVKIISSNQNNLFGEQVVSKNKAA